MRDIALDVYVDFCEVAMAEAGEVRSVGRISTRPEELELFAQSLDPRDRVALEVTGNAWAIRRDARADRPPGAAGQKQGAGEERDPRDADALPGGPRPVPRAVRA